MVIPRPRHALPLVLAVLLLAGLAGLASACPFCSEERGPTLVGDFKQAAMVLMGKFANARLDAANGGADGGSTEFVIEEVLKAHESLGNKKTITLPRYMPQTKNKFL